MSISIVVVGAIEQKVQITVAIAPLALGKVLVLHGLAVGQVLALSDILVTTIGPALLDGVDLAVPNRARNVQYSHWAGKVT